MLRLLLLFILLVQLATAQNEFGLHEIELKGTDSYFFLDDRINTETDDAFEFLRNHLPHLQHPSIDLSLISNIESPAGQHLLFQQLVNKKAVVNATIKVNCDKTGRVYALFDNSMALVEVPSENFPEKEIASIFAEENQMSPSSMDKFEVKEVYLHLNEKLLPCLSVEVLSDDIAFTAYLDKRGAELFREEHVQYLNSAGKDSLVDALVFLPDPLTSAKRLYEAPYLDYQDSNLVVLNNEMVNVKIKADFENGIFSLSGPFVKITNYKKPAYSPATSTTPFFAYNRSEQEFEDINTFFHISVFQEYVQSLGFMNLANYQIHAETHAYENDNSTFVSTHNPPRLNFGEGGVDDAEDADVIIHEYGHAIQRAGSPGTLTGFERKSLDEGNSDYLAASYSRSLDDFNWQSVFSWDGHNEFYDGRSVASSKHYPEDFQLASYHDNGEIWSSALMDIWTALGSQKTDELVLESFYAYAANINMSEAAMIVLASDSLLNNGDNYNLICSAFNNRGFSTICNGFTGFNDELRTLENEKYLLLNSVNFSLGGTALLQIKKKGFNGSWTLSDVNGKVIRKGSIKEGQNEIEIAGEGLTAGFYFMTVFSNDRTSESFKLIRSN